MQTLAPYAVIAAALTALALAVLFRRLLAPTISPAGVADFSPFDAEFYRPMGRLLNEEDIRFLRSQPGFEPRIEQRLRRERRAAFRSYLRHLRADFTRIHGAARFLVAHGAIDRPDLAAELMKQSLRFWTAYAWTSVWIEVAHFGPARNLEGLLEAPRWMQEQIGAITAPAAA